LKDLKKKTIRGLAWFFLDQAGSQFISFVITLLLARMLSPEQFGLIAMASVVIAITRIFIDSGLRDSLIQKQTCTQVDYSTVFYFNMVVSIGLFIFIFFIAPFVARFFGYEELTSIIRVLGLKPFLYSFTVVQTAIIHKDLRFSMLAKIRLPSYLISGVTGLILAWYNYGVWALVAQTILETLFFNVLLWSWNRWRPSLVFDKALFKFHWQHGSRLLIVSAVGAIYRNIFSLIIGKFFSAGQLGFYSRADSFKSITLNNTVGLVQTVSYPVLARLQNDHGLLKTTYRKILQGTLLVLLPIVAFFVMGAKSIITILLTDKWLPAAPILVVLMMAMVFSPFNSINLNILKVKRRTDLLLRVDIINKILMVAIVLVTIKLGFEYVIMTNLIIAVFALFINNYYTNKLISYSLKEQVMDMWPLLFSFIGSIVFIFLLQPVIVTTLPLINILITGLLIIGSYSLIIFILDRKFIFQTIDLVKTLTGKKSSI
jgi:teichuronic acid exporter